jgi:hypothetical protein
MADVSIDYQAVLTDLECRRVAYNSAVDTAIRSIRQILALTAGDPDVERLANQSSSAQSNRNRFLDTKLLIAAKMHLRSGHRKQTNKELAQALEAAGYVHKSKDFCNTVGSALWRASRNGDQDLLRRGHYWLLREWAPGRRRAASREPSDAKPAELQIAGGGKAEGVDPEKE